MAVYILGLVWMHMYPPQSCHSTTHGSREINGDTCISNKPLGGVSLVLFA